MIGVGAVKSLYGLWLAEELACLLDLWLRFWIWTSPLRGRLLAVLVRLELARRLELGAFKDGNW